MATYKLGIIGMGVMGQSILQGILKQKLFKNKQILLCDSEIRKLKKFRLSQTKDALDIAQQCEIILLCVKPQNLKSLWGKIKNNFKGKQLLISILAGIPLKYFTLDKLPVCRAMPNTPTQVKEGITVLCFNEFVLPKQKKTAEKIFVSCGKVLILAEEKLNAVTALSGSGPAYVFLFIESLISAGINIGLSQEVATELVLQTLKGALKMATESNLHPAQLKDMVTSPSGTTISALKILEKEKFRFGLIKAVETACKRAKELSQL